MPRVMRGLRDLGIVLRSVWLNVALFLALLLAAALVMEACGCYRGATFQERLVIAFYMARIESVPASPHPLVAVLVVVMPALTIIILGEGVLRLGAIYLGRRHHQQEWEVLMAGTLSGHMVLCGAGELGQALLEELMQRAPKLEVVVVDIHPGVLQELDRRGENLHHILGDITSVETLTAANVSRASLVLVTSGNDAHNLEAAFKVLRLNPHAETWVRLKHGGISEMLDTASRPNLHFFSPYQRAAKEIAEQLAGRAGCATKER